METHRCAPARGPYAPVTRTAAFLPTQADCNAPPLPPSPPDALERLAAAGIAEARAIVGVIALHATRDPAARRLLAHVAEALAAIAAEIDEAGDA